MANYINTILKKARNSIFRIEIEKVPIEIKETMEYLDMISREDKKIKTDYFYLDDVSEKTESSLDSSNSSNEHTGRNFLFTFYHHSNYQNHILRSLGKKFKIVSTIIGVLSLISIVMSQIEYELCYYPHFYPCQPKLKISSNYSGIYYRIINSAISVVLLILSFFHNKLLFKLQVESNQYYNKFFIQTHFFALFLFDSLISLIHPFPYYEKCIRIDSGIQIIYYNIQTFLYAFNFLKIYFVLRFLPLFSRYLKYRKTLPNKNINNNINVIFAVKAFQKDHPMLFLLFVILVFVGSLGIVLRLFEQPNTSEKSQDYEFFTNGFWTVILAMTTVGYGDFVPSTHFGRCVIIIATCFGTFITSLTILALTRTSSLDNEESNAFLILKRMKIRKALIDTCQRIFRISFKLKQISFEKTIAERFAESDYNCLVRELNAQIQKKNRLKRELMMGINNDQEEVLKTTQKKIKKNVVVIKNSLKILDKMKSILNIQLKEQDSLMQTLEQTSLINKNYIHNLFYFEFLLNNKAKDFKDIPDFLSNEDKNFTVDVEAFLFNKELRDAYLGGIAKRIFSKTVANSINNIYSVEDISTLIPKKEVNINQKEIVSLEIKEEKSKKILEEKSLVTYKAITEMKKRVKGVFSIEDFDNIDLNENNDNIKDINIEYLNFRKKKKIKQTVHFNQNTFKVRKVSSNSIGSNELLLDNQMTNTVALNTNSNLLHSNPSRRSEEDNIIKRNRSLWFGISSKTILFREKDRSKNKIIRPNKSNENKNATFINSS